MLQCKRKKPSTQALLQLYVPILSDQTERQVPSVNANASSLRANATHKCVQELAKYVMTLSLHACFSEGGETSYLVTNAPPLGKVLLGLLGLPGPYLAEEHCILPGLT